MEYKKIAKFIYKGNKYQLLIDKNNRYFFVNISNNDEISYIDSTIYLELMNLFSINDNYRYIKHYNSKISIVPKIIAGGSATVLTIGLLSGFAIQSDLPKYNNQINEPTQIVEIDYSKYYSSIDQDELDTISINDNVITIYELSFLDDYLDNKELSKEDILIALINNPNIDSKYKEIFKNVINTIYDKYPNIDKRIFYENVKTLKIKEFYNKKELCRAIGSTSADACYNIKDNEIYTIESYDYNKNTMAYQALVHEICHSMRNINFEKDDKIIKVRSIGDKIPYMIIEEALNSLFTNSILDYNEENISYQLQSNYCKIMLECLNNYSLDDYINHSLSYFAKRLDEQNNDDNYANVIFSLIDLQYRNFNNKDLMVDESEFYPIYDYLADMYFSKYINSNMTYSEAKEVADYLVNQLISNIDINLIDYERIYEDLDNYCELMQIQKEQYIKK